LDPDPDKIIPDLQNWFFLTFSRGSVSIIGGPDQTLLKFILQRDNPSASTVPYCGYLHVSDANPDPGSGAFLTPGYGMGKKSKSGSEIRIRDEHFGSYFRELRNKYLVKILKFFDVDPGSGNILTLDPGSGIRNGKNRIWDPG
jgi:hypothetical protein